MHISESKMGGVFMGAVFNSYHRQRQFISCVGATRRHLYNTAAAHEKIISCVGATQQGSLCGVNAVASVASIDSKTLVQHCHEKNCIQQL